MNKINKYKDNTTATCDANRKLSGLILIHSHIRVPSESLRNRNRFYPAVVGFIKTNLPCYLLIVTYYSDAR